jgi:zinc-ribbon domain
MKSKTGWIIVITLAVILLLVLPGIFMMGRFGTGGYGGMMGPGGMMGGYGYQNPLGFFGMALMWLIPLGFLVLVVFGVVALVNGLNKPATPVTPVSDRKCSNCGKQAQPDWKTCPYCGNQLK